MNKKILLCGSSTGGHVYPIFALGEELKKEYDITYLGIKGQFEERIFKDKAIYLKVKKNVKSLIFDKDSRKEIKQYQNTLNKFDIYIASGGIATYLITRFSKKKPLYLLEQNVILGDANLLFAFKAKKIFLSYKINSIFNFKQKLVGNPSYLRFKNNKRIKNKVIFMFGSLSSKSLTEKSLNYFLSPFFLKEYEYILVSKEKIKLNNNIKVIPYLNVEEYLDSSNIFFSRAGGSASYELMKYNVKVIFVPSPYVKHHHQEKNALFFFKNFNYPYILEKNFTPLNIQTAILKIKNQEFSSFQELDTYKLIKGTIDENI